MSLNTRQRQETILQKILDKGHVMVKDLAREMDVSDATVRRDLRVLADKGQIELVYGGASLPRNSDFSFRTKSTRNVEAKRTIGRLASELVPDNEQIFLDSGTTCLEMCKYLKNKQGLSVIVNSARLALELSNSKDLSVIVIGGHYRPDRTDMIGPLATAALDQLRGYMAFVGADGLSMDFGVTAGDIDSAYLYRLAVKNAKESVLLVDRTKFLSPSLIKIVDWEVVSRVVTDQAPPEDWARFLDNKGIQTIFPGCEGREGESNNESIN